MSLGNLVPPWHQFLDQKIRGAHFSLGIVAGERFVIELTPSMFPQRHVAGEGLNEGYDNVATFIQQSDPFHPFYDARSRLILEKTRKNKQAASAAITSGTAPTQCNHYILISTAARATYDQSNPLENLRRL
ncbi:hypothetical protein Tco_1425795 [Tanacetum coccineum]